MGKAAPGIGTAEVVDGRAGDAPMPPGLLGRILRAKASGPVFTDGTSTRAGGAVPLAHDATKAERPSPPRRGGDELTVRVLAAGNFGQRDAELGACIAILARHAAPGIPVTGPAARPPKGKGSVRPSADLRENAPRNCRLGPARLPLVPRSRRSPPIAAIMERRAARPIRAAAWVRVQAWSRAARAQARVSPPPRTMP